MSEGKCIDCDRNYELTEEYINNHTCPYCLCKELENRWVKDSSAGIGRQIRHQAEIQTLKDKIEEIRGAWSIIWSRIETGHGDFFEGKVQLIDKILNPPPKEDD